MIRLNGLGAIFLLGSALVGFVVRLFIPADPTIVSFAVAGVLMCFADLAYRSRQITVGAKTAYFSPKHGGQLIFIPCWLWGIFLLVSSALMELGYMSIPN